MQPQRKAHRVRWTLPYLVTQALEQIAAHRAGQSDGRHPLFTAIANYGLPEAAHNATALTICRPLQRRRVSFGWGVWFWVKVACL